MPYTNDGKAVMLDALRGAAPAASRGITTISLHSADPGTTGANELTGGSPAYARQAAAWGAPSAGAIALTGTETFNIPAGSTVAYAGFWSGEGTPKFLGSDQLSASEVFTGQGEYVLNLAALDLNS